MKKLLPLLLAGGICLLLFSCQKGQAPQETAPPEKKPEGIWEIGFSYDMFSGDQFCLEARVTDITPEGCRVKLLNAKITDIRRDVTAAGWPQLIRLDDETCADPPAIRDDLRTSGHWRRGVE